MICKKVYPFINNRDLICSIPGFAYFLYILFPIRFWEPFVFSNQIETTVITVYFSIVLLMSFLLKTYQTKIFSVSKIDLLLIIYGIYIICRLKYPIEKEILFTVFSIICIYLYFRNIPEDFLKKLLFLIPVAAIVQILDGINRFTMPWQNLSHIMGIFNNTGLFGGYAALSLVVCAGMMLLNDLGNRYLKDIIFGILGIVLAFQVYASGSRASWIALLTVSVFLMYKFVSQWQKRQKLHAQTVITGLTLNTRISAVIAGLTRNPLIISRWFRYFLTLILLILFILFSKHLYGIKKDSADGRLLIARVSMEMIKEAPVFGNGISAFRADYLNHQAAYFLSHPDSPYLMLAGDTETPFNEFLKILIEQGTAGLLLFFCVLYSLFEKRIPEQTNEKGRYVILQSVIVFILIFGLFSYPFEKIPYLLLFVFAISGLSKSRKPVFNFKLMRKRYLRTFIFLFFCIVSGIIAWNACGYSKACRSWNYALAHFAFGGETSLSQLKNLYPDLESNPVFLTTYGKALSYGGRYTEAAIVLEKAVKRQPLSFSYIELGKCYEALEFQEKAIACWKHAGLMVPSRFTPLYLTMKLHFNKGEYDHAREYAEKILAKTIKIDNPEIDAMKQEARKILNFHPPPE